MSGKPEQYTDVIDYKCQSRFDRSGYISDNESAGYKLIGCVYDPVNDKETFRWRRRRDVVPDSELQENNPDKLDLIANKLDKIIELLNLIELNASRTVLNTNKY